MSRETALALANEALATAQELGMKPLVERALALTQRAQEAEHASP